MCGLICAGLVWEHWYCYTSHSPWARWTAVMKLPGDVILTTTTTGWIQSNIYCSKDGYFWLWSCFASSRSYLITKTKEHAEADKNETSWVADGYIDRGSSVSMLWDITFSFFHRYLVCFPECIALWLVLLLRRFLILSEMRVVEGYVEDSRQTIWCWWHCMLWEACGGGSRSSNSSDMPKQVEKRKKSCQSYLVLVDYWI